MIGQTAYLPIIAVRSNDQDGSETTKLELTGFSQGTVLTDGANYITIASNQQWVDVSTWNWTQLRFASSQNQDMNIQIKATAIEQSNQHSTCTIKNIAIKMLDGQAYVNP